MKMFPVVQGDDGAGESGAGPKSECATCVLGLASAPNACPFKETIKPAGTVLLEQGRLPEATWYLRSGQVLLSVTTGAAAGTCMVRGAGALLGLEALLGEPSVCEAHALTEIKVCALSAKDFKSWVGPMASPQGVVLTLALREASRQTAERIALEGSATQRVARFLLSRHVAGLGDQAITIQKQLLARVLGMRPETLSRSLAELRERGVVARGRRISIIDLPALEQIAAVSAAS
ncbi:MAG: Crp/Fnr family transcriptional regulator [Sorangiineae bacterium]|nr:Crp/Fnr family transcriptional regulator [Polyangiaceae bacterium]MEB2322963.1 Crp/Fnr family transcriptional regulator [Sorangiineae bacterium]